MINQSKLYIEVRDDKSENAYRKMYSCHFDAEIKHEMQARSVSQSKFVKTIINNIDR